MYVEILQHPVRPNQKIFLVPYHGYIHVVPFVIDEEDNIILKTVFRSRKFLKMYGGIEEGLPYQTLISSILYKYVNHKLVDEASIRKTMDLLRR